MTHRQAAPRPIWEIASDITHDWKKVNYAAQPYLDAMHNISKITDIYFADSAKSVVLYFLSNAASYRGERARALKAELKAILKEVE
jgi:hypothetical protein